MQRLTSAPRRSQPPALHGQCFSPFSTSVPSALSGLATRDRSGGGAGMGRAGRTLDRKMSPRCHRPRRRRRCEHGAVGARRLVQRTRPVRGSRRGSVSSSRGSARARAAEVGARRARGGRGAQWGRPGCGGGTGAALGDDAGQRHGLGTRDRGEQTCPPPRRLRGGRAAPGGDRATGPHHGAGRTGAHGSSTASGCGGKADGPMLGRSCGQPTRR
jgi:hypothetical protein